MASRNPIVDAGLRFLREVLKASPQSRGRTATRTRPRATLRTDTGYPGDFTGTPQIAYSPFNDDKADPGEVVWTWVPYEEDHHQGKDRPVLIIGHDGRWLLALQVTSQDHDLDAAQEARAGRYWEDIGTGAWDPQGRPSEVRVNRIIRIDPKKVRRIGAMLDEDTFLRVAKVVRKHS
ncbi:MAG: type II toxin-antitoxin system PemK/MazF family toxin [Propionibacteriaceae bacterium]|nr:type II toxin-antitoxin system PemK/MazF family toxin [Propionibacteriaceae bacterium]